MDLLRTKLHAQSKRKDLGSVSVLVHGPTGAGKSHLAREYLFRSRLADEYPGGTFWIDCKSEEACSRGFWDIAQAAALLNATERRSQESDAANMFLDSVRRWLESRDGWLMVFDGVAFDSEEEIEQFVKFIPDRKGNHIIFTSVDKTLARRQRLLNPMSVKVHPLSLDDARTLLFKILHIKSPNTVQTAKAKELVQYYERLPLAIHAVAHMLIAKGRALETFSIGSTDKRLAAPYLEIMQALRDNSHVEAINLITILSFFNHNIPVALVLLGRRVLSDYTVEIRSTDREGSTKRELDNTIAVLIKYGLIERSLQSYHLVDKSLSDDPSVHTNGDSSPELIKSTETDTEITESSSDEKQRDGENEADLSRTPKPLKIEPVNAPLSGVDKRPESSIETSSSRSAICSIDILRTRTVVQGIYRDDMRLRDRDKYYWWLTVAARLCCMSYHVADERIRASSRQGLVRDYREYETQVAAIRSHFPRPEKAPEGLKRARRELHRVMRAIRQEIENRSPSQSSDCVQNRVQVSIFERSSSTSSDAPETPIDGSRSSTWSFEEAFKTESPAQLQQSLLPSSLEASDSWDERGYESGIDSVVASTTRRSSRSEVTDILDKVRQNSLSQRRPSFMSFFKGKPIQPKKQKDLGEWKPLPAPPSLSHADAQGATSIMSSSTNSGEERPKRPKPISSASEAEAALVAVHRNSPPASRGGRIRSPSRPRAQDDTVMEISRQPLGLRSPNLSLSPLVNEFHPGTSTGVNRQPLSSSGSPRLGQSVLFSSTDGLGKALPPLPIEESITITRRIPTDTAVARQPLANLTNQYISQFSRPLPTGSGYTSQPMSRDNSKDSQESHATAPAAVPGSASLGTSPMITEPYLYSRPGPASIDLVSASAFDLERMGEWTDVTRTVPHSPELRTPDSIITQGTRKGSVQFDDKSPVEITAAKIGRNSMSGRRARS